jgi:hypothetical protein
MRFGLFVTPLLTFLICVTACGDSKGRIDADGGVEPNDPDASTVDEQGIAFRTLLMGFDRRRGFFHAPSNRLFSLPDALAASMKYVTVAEFDGDQVVVRALAVRGEVPTGRVESFTYAPGIDRFVAIVRARQPHRIEVVSVELGSDDATFTVLVQPEPVEADGYQFGDLYPRSGAALVVERGNEVLPLTIGETEASWGTPLAGHFFRSTGSPVVFDSAGGQLVGFGIDAYNPETMQIEFQPTVGTLSLSGPYQWTELSLGNAPEASSSGGWELWAAWDATEQRLFTVVPMDDDCGGEPCTLSTLWAADLQQGEWTHLLDYFYPPSGYESPFVSLCGGR